ncbi:hypothetical protein CKO28_08310 [Rhodovibrio sodomensis]|uniref:Lytic murein transglycosylase n=1 Tax=Rhodovibrio sodomensis TaxID=1088 RepID=A0ABS1DC34_9PROT|nr:lytic murein transglycosylase [Rhodovibrio sodomensis]MBK1668038.1 hypothetical protein [Rhodovibrio sodomensis]
MSRPAQFSLSTRLRRRLLAVSAGLLTAAALAVMPGSATAQQNGGQGEIAPRNDQPFDAWLQNLRDQARNAGIGAATLDSALQGVAPVNRVIELDRRQPEFTRTFWSYLDKRVSEGRIERGRELLAKHRDLLERIEADYGVQPRFLIAFWGLETNFGDYLGSFQVIDALATLAYDQRRGDFFRAQLLDALRIVDQGHITAANMKGSWAGAMGQLQFIPSTFVGHAVDRTGDGQKDIWGSLPDVFASGANYLSDLGWEGDQLWGREVVLPDGFDLSQASLSVRKPLDAWAALGVRKANGQPLSTPEGMQGSVVLPQGHEGPAFLVYENFRHILSWNSSINYAIAVGHLADRIVGLPAIQHGRDADNRPLSFSQAKQLQRLLNQLGFGAGPVDGVPGSQTRAAIRDFQQANGLPADGYPSVALLQRLQQKAGQ